MANKNLFNSQPHASATLNEAGGVAYALAPKHALAQYAMTGCLNGTYYASADEQLQKVLELSKQVEPEFIARLAIVAREKGFMKDLPALLVAILAVRSPGLLAEVFDRVIDNTKMLRNFVQIIRSGVVGRKSLGSLPKRMVLQWLENHSDAQLFKGSIGNDPSLADVVKMVHPKPASLSRQAFYGWLLGREYSAQDLPEIVREFEAFKQAGAPVAMPVPDVPFQMLTALPLVESQWKEIARNAPWQMTRMNLNTFARHGVFKDEMLVGVIADRLKDPKEIKRARVFPYQLMSAAVASGQDVPRPVVQALHEAMEVAIENVPGITGKVYILLDVSGSMHSPATGYRPGATTAARCMDVAALVAAAIVRKNPDAKVIPFHDRVVGDSEFRIGHSTRVVENAQALTRINAGGTDCSAPMKELVARKASADLVIYVSDNESWLDSGLKGHRTGNTQTYMAWKAFKKINPLARLVCIDIQPYGTTQAPEADDVINVGGFSDQVFELLAAVAAGQTQKGYWVRQIESTSL